MHKSFDELVVQPDLTTDYELAALECPLFSVPIGPILLKLLDNQEMHNILDELKFRTNYATGNRGSCP